MAPRRRTNFLGEEVTAPVDTRNWELGVLHERNHLKGGRCCFHSSNLIRSSAAVCANHKIGFPASLELTHLNFFILYSSLFFKPHTDHNMHARIPHQNIRFSFHCPSLRCIPRDVDVNNFITQYFLKNRFSTNLVGHPFAGVFFRRRVLSPIYFSGGTYERPAFTTSEVLRMMR